MWLPEEDKYTNRKNELLAGLAVSMGGRVAEEIIFGDITNGARGDIKMATAIARRMVCEWGMSEKMGMVEYGDHEDYVFLGREMHRNRDYSEATAQEIDREVRKLCDDAYQRAKELLNKNRAKLEAIAKALLEYETLDGAQIRDIIFREWHRRQGFPGDAAPVGSGNGATSPPPPPQGRPGGDTKASQAGSVAQSRPGGAQNQAEPQQNPRALAVIAERIRAGVEALPAPVNGAAVTISIGAAACPDDGAGAEALFQAADQRLYQAKRDGRNRVVAPTAPRAGQSADRSCA